MRIVRFTHVHETCWGVLAGDIIQVLKHAPYDGLAYEGRCFSVENVCLLAPVMPSKIVLAGLNYREHASELNMALPDEPIIFMKPTTAIIAPEHGIVYHSNIGRLDYEAELAVVIRKQAYRVQESDVGDYIFGYTCVNDVTARDLQHKDGQWTRAKSFDTFCPVGPWIETELDPSHCVISTHLNGEQKQSSTTRDFIFSVPYLVSYISHIMTLMPGDLIATGTPSGIGPMVVGDEIVVTIEGIGSLRNVVIASEKL